MSDTWGGFEQLVGRWDPDTRLFIATGWTYGPAGPASLDLSSGVRLSVDFANPTVTNEITIEAPLTGDPADLDGENEDAARAMLGPGALRRLLSLSSAAAVDRAARLTDDFDYQEPEQGLRRDALGRFVVLAETATDADQTDLKAAMAGLEAAAVASVADPAHTILARAAGDIASVAADAFLRVIDAGSVQIEDPRVEQELTAVIRRALQFVDDDLTARRLRRFASQLEDGRFRGRPPLAAAAVASFGRSDRLAAGRPDHLAAPSPTRAATGGVDVDGTPGAAAMQIAPTEISVYSPPGVERRWARVFRRHDRLLLALAPLRTRTDGQSALLVIPTGFEPNDLLVDITDEPEAARPSDELVALRSAVPAGRDACRLERIRDEGAASRRWAECSQQWFAVGDRERAETAQRYARGDRQELPRTSRRRRLSTPQEAFLADRME